MGRIPRRHVAALLGLCLVWLGLYALYWSWGDIVVEDAAISFAYARNLAEGEGLVALPGGERVEGYSNLLWVLLLAVPYKAGISPFVAARGLGAVLGVLCLPLTYALTRQARPGGQGDVALLAAALLAGSSQHLVWSGTGLEGGLFGFLLLAGLVRLGVELEQGSRPWSALLFFLLCLTRPEAPAYAAFAGLAVWAHHLRRGHWRRALGWATALVLPLVLYHSLRVAYFAWPFPNTYYAKLGRDGVYQPFGWSAAGWLYIRGWFKEHLVVWLVPLLGLAMVGTNLRRWWLVVVGSSVLACLIGWAPGQATKLSGSAAIEGLWIPLRVWAIPAVALLLALAAIGLPGARTRALLWANAAFGIFFALYTGGDWMPGFRWFGIIVISLLPLLAIGVGEILDVMMGRPEGRPEVHEGRVATLVVIAVLWAAVEGEQTSEVIDHPPIEVRDVARRVAYMREIRDELDLDHVEVADVDMGAHLWYAPRWDIIDYAGLVDVPVGRRTAYPIDFIARYLFDEHRPAFFHIHGGWSDRTHVLDLPFFDSRYVELPPQRVRGGHLHRGHFVDKGLFVQQTQGIPTDAHRFGQDVALDWLRIRAPQIAPGMDVVVESGWQVQRYRDDFEVYLFVDEPGRKPRVVEPHQPGWTWYPPSAWAPGEEVIARTHLSIPHDMPLGAYTLGIVVRDAKSGLILSPSDGEAEERVNKERLLTSTRVEVVSSRRAHIEAEQDRDEARRLLGAGACEAAWLAWKEGAWHLGAKPWADKDMLRGMAGCLAARAAATADPEARVDALLEGLRWDRRLPALTIQAVAQAADLDAQGDEQAAAGVWDAAFRSWDRSVRLDPRRSWTRRKAEEARDLRPSKYSGAELVEGEERDGAVGGWWSQAAAVGAGSPLDEEGLALQALGYTDAEVDAPGATGVTVYDRARACPGINLVLSTEAPGAELVAMDGRVLHRWSVTVELAWPGKAVPAPSLPRNFWRRARLLPDGDLLAIFEQIGLIRLDLDSGVRWALPARIHHDVELLPNGELLALGFAIDGVQVRGRTRPRVLDQIVRLAPDGKIEQMISVLDGIRRSPWSWLLSRLDLSWGDLLHANDIAVIDEAAAARLPGTAPGQILLSLREESALVTVDLKRGEVTGLVEGAFRRQHDPDLLPDGEILLFDNGELDAGRSRVVQLDPSTGQTTWSYEGDAAHPLHSRILGEVQRLPNGDTLITESVAGRVIEVTPAGEIVWEYINPHRGGEHDELIAMLPQVERVPCAEIERWLDLPDGVCGGAPSSPVLRPPLAAIGASTLPQEAKR